MSSLNGEAPMTLSAMDWFQYFKGIIFLRTNRINAFDKAMTFIMKISEDSVIEGCDNAFLDALADRELNGRQIKDAVRTGLALSVSRNEHLTTRHLLTSPDSLTQFDAQLEPDFADSPADAPTPMDHGRYTIGRKRQRLY
ncbi:hypothetical protein DM02DRAFT_673560 [Periconia macrospinosa]|uniref:Uncharacterized protein n=1 Tax=Periconia macrospinosa TaxID=97972 RepID=A0A2V1DJZ6_9PLEO|nr:hypothetical protein DM02DRAFT_673560 [Periconia macrospinosa]